MKFMTGEWLKAAQLDLMTMEEIKDNEHLTTIIAFHAQQCIEKVFKAVIEEKSEKIEKIHDLLKLKDKISTHLPIQMDEKTIELINQLYIESRYPGDLGLLPTGRPSTKEAKIFYETASCIYNDVKKFLENQSKGA